MCGAVLPHADRVVREDVDRRNLHDRGQPDRAAGEVGEDQETRPEGADFRQGKPVRDCAGSEFAHAEVQIAPARIVRLQVTGTVEGQPRLGRRRQVRGAADQPRVVLGQRVQHLPGRRPRCDALRVGGKGRNVGVPADGQFATLHPVELVGQVGKFGPIGLEGRLPLAAQSGSTRADPFGEVLVDTIRDEELLVGWEAVELLGRADLVLPERLAVCGGGALLRRCAVGDVAVDDDQRRAVLLARERFERAAQHLQVVGVAHPGDVPAIADEPGGDVLGERDVGRALDGDLVVVVDPAQVRQLQMRCQRSRFGRDAFHHAAVAGECVHVETEQLMSGAVVGGGEPVGGNRHADAGRHTRAQRAGGALDPGRPAVLRVARTLGVELAELLQVVQLHRRFAHRLVVRVDGLHVGQMKDGIEQRRGMPRRQHKPVPVRPDRIRRIEPENFLPQGVHNWRHRHRGPRMPGVRGLNGVNAQGANRVDAQGVDIWSCNNGRHFAIPVISLRTHLRAILAGTSRHTK